MDEKQVVQQEADTKAFRTQASTKMPDPTEVDGVQDSVPGKASLPAKGHEQADDHGEGFLEPRTNVTVLEPSESENPNVE